MKHRRMRLLVSWIAATSVLLLATAGPLPALAEVRLPKIFSDNMMIQRDQPVRVWGWADPGEDIKVIFAGKAGQARADAKGAWAAELPAVHEGDNLEMSVTGRNAVVLKNLIVGDIWLCSGQSNMAMPLRETLPAREDAGAANSPKIRRIKLDLSLRAEASEDVPAMGPWQVCTPACAGAFSAMGFHFAREIHRKTGVPIGLLESCWGATRIEPWISPASMASTSAFRQVEEERQKALAAYKLSAVAALDATEKWLSSNRDRIRAGGQVPPAPTFPQHPWAEFTAWHALYNGMIHPVVRFPIKGALWSQGEANGYEGYGEKMKLLIGGWRKAWNLGEFPFYYTQLSTCNDYSPNPWFGDSYAKIRDEQCKALAITNTGMAVVLDIGDNDVHYKNKYDAGVRLARWALARDYGQRELEVSGPLFRQMKIEGGQARITFNHVGTGLLIGKKVGQAPTEEDRGGKLQGFAVAGADKKWKAADAVIEGASVVVSSPEVPAPVAVRYAFAHRPKGPNLYNREGLPASPFRTDDW
jgi:sialate O-acetylesterase